MARRRAGGPILMVLVTSALLLAGARFIGRVAASREEARKGTSRPVQTMGAADLTFYDTLGDPPPGRKGASPDGSLRPAPGDLVPAQGIYVVQVLGSADEAQAKKMKERLASHGFQAAILEDEGGSGTFKVRVGRWANSPPAEAMAERIRKATGLQPWVLREGSR